MSVESFNISLDTILSLVNNVLNMLLNKEFRVLLLLCCVFVIIVFRGLLLFCVVLLLLLFWGVVVLCCCFVLFLFVFSQCVCSLDHPFLPKSKVMVLNSHKRE